MATPNLAALETVITAVGWSGGVSIRSGCDTDVTNSNVPEDASLSTRHLGSVKAGASGSGPGAARLTVEVRTVTSGIGIALALRTEVSGADGPAAAGIPEQLGGLHTHRFELSVNAGEPVTVLKTVAVASSRDHAIASPLAAARAALARAPEGFAALLAEHEAAWETLLKPFIIEFDASSQAQLILNLHVSTCCRRSPPTPPNSTPASRPAACTARATVGTFSGMSSSSCRC